MHLSKKEKILIKHLVECRRKLLVERRVTAFFHKTRVNLQRGFTAAIDRKQAQIDLLQACLVKVVKERDKLEKRLTHNDELRRGAKD
jgi:hypothetical protein